MTLSVSPIAPDWIGKGCHVYFEEFELAVKPDHQTDLVVLPVFSRDANQVEAVRACTKLRNLLLSDPSSSEYLMSHVSRARDYLGVLPMPGAQGKATEMHFLLASLRKAINAA